MSRLLCCWFMGVIVLGAPAVVGGQDTAADDRAALEALYDATDGANWKANDNWKTDEPLDQWHGVTTDSDGRVTSLVLFANQLRGAIPSEIGNLTSLDTLVLAENELSGPIPSEVGNLTSLRSLWLNDNRLTGQVPAALSET